MINICFYLLVSFSLWAFSSLLAKGPYVKEIRNSLQEIIIHLKSLRKNISKIIILLIKDTLKADHNVIAKDEITNVDLNEIINNSKSYYIKDCQYALKVEEITKDFF